jgi:hypothetical protein
VGIEKINDPCYPTPMKTILLGLTLIAAGFLVIWKTNWFVENFGSIGWAEEHLGSGGTWSFYKILGVILILAAFIIVL